MAFETKWGDPSQNGANQSEADLTSEAAAQTDEEKAAELKAKVSYLKALRESGRAVTKEYMDGFHDAWLYTIGEKRFPAPQDQAAKQREKHLSRTTRPQMFAMMDHKVSFITDAEPRILMKALQPISEADRRQLESVLESELDRLHWNEDALEVAWDSEVGSIGYTMFELVEDDMTGEKKITTRTVDPSRIGVNKQATSPRDARYMTFEDTLSLAEIRRRWPVEGEKVKPLRGRPYGAAEDAEYHESSTDDELVEMPGNEFLVTKEGQVVDQEATVTWAWEPRRETQEVWEEFKNQTTEPGWYCPMCDANYLAEDAMCPDCAAQGIDTEMEPVDLPEGADAKKKFIRRTYPFGRCLIGIPEQNIILYDGPNEMKLERVFPFARAVCYRKSRCYFGMGDYHLLKSNQKARDQNIGLLRDHLRYNAHPILEHPESAEAYAIVGTAPGSRASVPDDVAGQARFLSGAHFDYQGFLAAERALDADAKEATGVDEILLGGGVSPESGEAIKARIQARSKRIAGSLKRFNEYRTDYAAIVWELMKNHYTEPRTFTVKGPSNQLDAITMTVSELPYDVVVMVTADPDKVETDRLMGQNLGQFIMSGAIFDPRLLPFMDEILTGFGIDPMRSEIVQQKLNEYHQNQMEQQAVQQQIMGSLGLPQGGTPPSPAAGPEGGPPQQPSPEPQMMEGAMP